MSEIKISIGTKIKIPIVCTVVYSDVSKAQYVLEYTSKDGTSFRTVINWEDAHSILQKQLSDESTAI